MKNSRARITQVSYFYYPWTYGFIEIRFFIKTKKNYTDLEILLMSKFSVGRYKEALTKNQVMRTKIAVTRLNTKNRKGKAMEAGWN